MLSLLLMVAVPYTLALTAGQNPNDDFNDNSIDANKWLVCTTPTGSVTETNQELQMELNSSSTESMFEAGVTSNWTIGGDFDIQVDYNLTTWPENNGIRLVLQAGPPTVRGAPDVVQRVSAEPEWGIGEVYLTHFSDGVHGITPTDHTSGKLRLIRNGSTMTGYYFDGSGWITLHSAPTSTGNGTVKLWILGGNATLGGQVAFDNFVVNYGQVSELPPTTEEVYSPEGIDPYFTMHVVYLLMIPPSHAHEIAHQMLRMMAQNLAGLGIEVHLNFVPMEEMGTRVFSGRIYTEGGYDTTFFAFLMGQPANLSETAQWMRETYHSSYMPSGSGIGYNLMMWNNTENDALLDAAVASTNTTEIEILLHEWQALFYQEQPAAIVYYRNSRYGLHSAYGQASLNMLHPVFGTGINTPLGQSNVTRADEAARYVRQAISYTIDREWAASNLGPGQQPAQPGITPITPSWPGFDPSLQPYALNLTEARRLLSLAGYGPSASELIEELIKDIEQMNIKQGISNSLDAKLSGTLASLEALNSDKRNDAINKLEAVISETEAQREKFLTNEQADYIISEAYRIIDQIME